MTLKDKAITRAKWYVRWRTTIWASVWCIAGVFGGNADRIKDYVPTLNYGTSAADQKAQEYQQKLQKLKKDLDKLRTDEV